MSIDIYFHSKLPLDETVKNLDEVEEKFKSLYENDFLLYSPRTSTELQKNIASGFNGFISEAKFIIAVNNKKRADEIKDLSLFFKNVFGADNILTLIDNESLVEE